MHKIYTWISYSETAPQQKCYFESKLQDAFKYPAIALILSQMTHDDKCSWGDVFDVLWEINFHQFPDYKDI